MDEWQVRARIDQALNNSTKVYAMENGRLVRLHDVIKVRELNAFLGLIIAYSAGSFMTIDRFYLDSFHPIRQKRIINRLNSHSGQINTALLLELLRLRDRTKLSKYDIIRKVQNKYFISQPIGTKDITESLNRMLRKTMVDYFWFEGKYFRRSNFDLRLIELPNNANYDFIKINIDNIIQF
ncbi:MAG: hypothetical protein K9W46_05920 [Candidatus Heimdallarchaeum endolithica]|uniref:Uncharacterized protein n=1 Tax=Candidatus Heimdallarchaeum endolithica TaxID=2876572 RepID=A0A9Y1BTE5_9ARCH|nr:MAG: hypothetical protein K9W46_05920 [Candidatus Heimdallarchaeum endolithica]